MNSQPHTSDEMTCFSNYPQYHQKEEEEIAQQAQAVTKNEDSECSYTYGLPTRASHMSLADACSTRNDDDDDNEDMFSLFRWSTCQPVGPEAPRHRRSSHGSTFSSHSGRSKTRHSSIAMSTTSAILPSANNYKMNYRKIFIHMRNNKKHEEKAAARAAPLNKKNRKSARAA